MPRNNQFTEFNERSAFSFKRPYFKKEIKINEIEEIIKLKSDFFKCSYFKKDQN